VAEIQTISLHDASSRMAARLRSTPGSARGALLSLLRSGAIKAGFLLPGPVSCWIEIPPDFWISITTNKFDVVRRRKGKAETGIFLISPGDFAELIVSRVSPAKNPPETWASMLRAASGRYEVFITETAWRDYEDAHPVKGGQLKSNQGRDALKGWREVSVIIGAYVVKHYQEAKHDIKADEASQIIWQSGKDQGIEGLPTASTIRDHLRAILKHARDIPSK
jgi:hypothetical protein